ncbi:hypothetical protein [Luedemannella helvata]|uniref:Secreted protein n=1 Tax=Luedemannella helvata TaxID=349315 RepID=A0ABN2KB19_9ACTN
MTATQIVITVIVVLVVVAAVIAGVLTATRWSLRRQFGPEYDRLVAERGGRVEAERELRERRRRHAALSLRTLDDEARDRYASRWADIQARFLDEPQAAVADADALVADLLTERGYPESDVDERVALLSVEHAGRIEDYRTATGVAATEQATTEQLRQAIVHYRTVISDLIGGEPLQLAGDPTETTPSTR